MRSKRRKIKRMKKRKEIREKREDVRGNEKNGTEMDR